MPFGRHRGTPLSELPSDYVAWLRDKFNEWRDPFRSALATELDRRKEQMLPNVVDGSPAAPCATDTRTTAPG